MGRRNKVFHFKQFSVDHSNATMKVGTDGVLLGAWANVEGCVRLLDIGTGSGVIALMLAQRSSSLAKIDAVEIEPVDAAQAQVNIGKSPWPDKVEVHCIAVQSFAPSFLYDCIISNPPYFSNSFEPPDPRRVEARHTSSLTFHDLLFSANRLLAKNGSLNVVLPHVEGLSFIELAKTFGLFCSRNWTFKTRYEKPIERHLLEFKRVSLECECREIVLYNEGENWSEDYKNLTRDFYLKI